MSKYRILIHNPKDDILSLESTKYFTLEKKGVFLWIQWWSPVKENGEICKFNTRKEALEKYKSFK
jgi:hypothetical protein